MSNLPLKSFYRYVLAPELQFDPDRGTIAPPAAYFTNVPESKILTMGIDEPESWSIMSHYAPVDLDNIKLEDMEAFASPPPPLSVYPNPAPALSQGRSRSHTRSRGLSPPLPIPGS